MELRHELKKFINENDLSKKINQYSVFSNWQSIVGDLISQHTVPQTIKNDMLYIKVENSAWKTELEFMKVDLLKKIQKESKQEIKKIKLI